MKHLEDEPRQATGLPEPRLVFPSLSLNILPCVCVCVCVCKITGWATPAPASSQEDVSRVQKEEKPSDFPAEGLITWPCLTLTRPSVDRSNHSIPTTPGDWKRYLVHHFPSKFPLQGSSF